MVCENCQAEISDNAVICPHCKSFTKNMTPELQEKLTAALKQREIADKREAKTIIKTVVGILILAVVALIITAIKNKII